MNGPLRVARAVCVCSVLAAACTEPLPPIVLDISKNCNEVDVIVVAHNLGESDVGRDEIVDAASDGSAVNAAWVLYVPKGGESGNLFVRHLVGDRVVSEVDIGILASDKAATQLRAAPTRDEVYVTRQGPGDFRLWRVSETGSTLWAQGSVQLGTFPRDEHTCTPACDTTDWQRELIFLEGQPHLMAVPPFSPTVAISVWVGVLVAGQQGTGTFSLNGEHRLNFEPRCDPGVPLDELQLCEGTNAMVSHPTVQVLSRQIDPRPATSALLATRGRQEGDIAQAPTTHDIFVVHVGLDEANVPAGILRSEQSDFETTQPPTPPSGMAVDEFATYALVNRQLDGAKLLRLELATFDQGFSTLPVTALVGRELLQLDNDIALGRILDGRWEITKLFPDSVDQSRTTTYESSASILDSRVVGPGLFLLQREQAAPELVRLVCATSSEAGGEQSPQPAPQ